jgi:hypothetical protein
MPGLRQRTVSVCFETKASFCGIAIAKKKKWVGVDVNVMPFVVVVIVVLFRAFFCREG